MGVTKKTTWGDRVQAVLLLIFSAYCLVVLGYLLAISAQASTFEAFGTSGTYDQDIPLLSPAGADNKKVGQGPFNFTAPGTIGALQIPTKKVGEPAGAFVFELYAGGGTPDAGTLVASSTLASSTVGFDYATSTFVFNTPYTITSTSTNYWLSFRRTDSATSGVIYYAFPGSTTSTMPGSLWTLGGSWNQSASIDIGPFLFTGEVGTIGIVFPKNISLTGDFSAFQLSSIFGPGDIEFIVDYGTSTSNLNSTSTSYRDILGFSSGGFVDTRDIYVAKRNALTAGTRYYERATLQIDGSTVASTSIFSFEISGDAFIDNLTFQAGAPTTTSTDLVITCDPDSSFWDRSWCNLYTYLFVPKPTVWDPFKELKYDIENKPPFGYLTMLGGQLEELTATASGTIGLSSISGLTAVWTPIRAILATLLALAFLFAIITFFRHYKF